ncbi:hypothetical protein BX600DRAFT_550615 [Xylariales sp. PMI_506]|nr:hypothetical protein BX600DRAFT_550615 [Xylariales sp. PMI_506]
MSSLCSFCSAITLESLVQDPAFVLAANFDDILQRAAACQLCRLLSSGLQSAAAAPPSTKRDPPVRLTGISPTDPQTTEQLTGVLVSCNGRSATFNLCANSSNSPPVVAGRLVTQDLDAAKVSYFATDKIVRCDAAPGHARCRQLFTGEAMTESYAPPRLWNVTTMKLEENPMDVKYIALSYTWGGQGKVYPICTLKKNVKERENGGSLPAEWLKVYSRAFEITRQMGLTYIWIDSLCIVQDDPGDQKSNFDNHVHRIYQNALLTLCCIFQEPGDDPMQPRDVPTPGECVAVFNNRCFITPRKGTPVADLGGAGFQKRPYWGGRGWTFQERALSPRCVYLTGHQLYWECRTELWEEGGMLHSPISYKNSSVGNENQGSRWQLMVREYSNRELGYYSDKIPAFLGVANQLSEHMSPGAADPFVKYGFLGPRIGRDLLWESAAGAGASPLTVLTLNAARKEVRKVLPAPHAWSWAFWNGSLDFESYLETATLTTPSDGYTVDDHGILLVLGARMGAAACGAPMASSKSMVGPTDIVYSVSPNNLVGILDGQRTGLIGWAALDRDPDRPGALVSEKDFVLLSVSSTGWGASGDSSGAGHSTANVLVLNKIQIAPGVDGFARVGTGQVWDARTVVWMQTGDKIRIASPIDLVPQGSG